MCCLRCNTLVRRSSDQSEPTGALIQRPGPGLEPGVVLDSVGALRSYHFSRRHDCVNQQLAVAQAKGAGDAVEGVPATVTAIHGIGAGVDANHRVTWAHTAPIQTPPPHGSGMVAVPVALAVPLLERVPVRLLEGVPDGDAEGVPVPDADAVEVAL